ncbi:MAG: hypothetical protein OEU32_03810 [Acidimicrobiia bacterium]|nr:hypothetical protein [Acidimicrobiia bacterium]
MTDPVEPMLLDELADWLGGSIWVGERLFETLGAWSTDESRPDRRVRFAIGSRRLGEHSRLWRDQLPDSPALDVGPRIVPPRPGWNDAVSVLAELDPADRLVAFDEIVVPVLVQRVHSLLGRLRAVSDASVIRAGRIVAADLAELGFGVLSPSAADREAVRRRPAIRRLSSLVGLTG